MNSKELEIIEKSKNFAINRMKKLHSSHGWDHVERVGNLANIICETEPGADKFIVTVSAILHDIAREDEDNSNGEKCHATLGGQIAYNFLIKEGLEEKKAKHISDCIHTHRYRNDHKPDTIEAKIIFDSDKLDSIGAVGIGRAFLFSGEIGAKLSNSTSDILSTNAYSEEDTAFREFKVKLIHIKKTMLTKEGKKLAEERHKFMEVFFEKFNEEIRGIS